MFLIAYSKLGNIFWLKFDETSHKTIHIMVTKMAENVSEPTWQALEGDGVIWAREKSEMS